MRITGRGYFVGVVVVIMAFLVITYALPGAAYFVGGGCN